jgi:hypothetical protein
MFITSVRGISDLDSAIKRGARLTRINKNNKLKNIFLINSKV